MPFIKTAIRRLCRLFRDVFRAGRIDSAQWRCADQCTAVGQYGVFRCRVTPLRGYGLRPVAPRYIDIKRNIWIHSSRDPLVHIHAITYKNREHWYIDEISTVIIIKQTYHLSPLWWILMNKRYGVFGICQVHRLLIDSTQVDTLSIGDLNVCNWHFHALC